MSEPQLPREVRRRLAIIQHAEEVTGNVAMTCRYYGISRQVYYRWLRRYQDQGIDGLRDLSRRPRHSPNATHVDLARGSDNPNARLKSSPPAHPPAGSAHSHSDRSDPCTPHPGPHARQGHR
jgi:transposase-like protein